MCVTCELKYNLFSPSSFSFHCAYDSNRNQSWTQPLTVEKLKQEVQIASHVTSMARNIEKWMYASCLLAGAYLYFSTHFRTPCLGNSVAHTGLGLPMSSNLDNPLQTFEKANPMQIILHWYSLLRWFGWLSSQQLKSTITKVLPHESSM